MLAALAAAAALRLQARALQPCVQLASQQRASLSTLPDPSQPLRLFVCTGEPSGDEAGAALVEALRKQHPGGVQLWGLGGPKLTALGLKSVVSDPKCFEQCTVAEQVARLPFMAYKYHPADKVRVPGMRVCAQHLQNITEAAVDSQRTVADTASGNSSGGSSTKSTTTPATTSSSSSGSSGSQGVQPASTAAKATAASNAVPPGIGCDAILTIGSSFLSTKLLGNLQVAVQRYQAKLPPLVHYLVPDASNFRSLGGSLKAIAKAADHVMCGLSHEPALLQAQGCPATHVGHPLAQQLLGSARLQGIWFKEKLAGSGGCGDAPFRRGDGAAFCRRHGLAVDGLGSSQQQQQGSSQQQQQGSSQQQQQGSSQQQQHSQQHAQQHGRAAAEAASEAATAAAAGAGHPHLSMSVCLLPGCKEQELVALIPAFDIVTRSLAMRHPGLSAVMLVPPFWLNLARDAVANFGLPVVVADLEREGADAMAACSVALTYGGDASLHCVAAGLPMVCVQPAQLARDALAFASTRRQLPHSCVPNLLLGRRAVPEQLLWGFGALSKVERQLEALMMQEQLRRDQKQHLREAVVAMLPPSPAGHSSVAILRPADVAARTLLELVQLRRQDQQQQLGMNSTLATPT